MSVIRYYARPEEHIGQPVQVRDSWRPGIRFRFAIRRGDGSLVFRTETAKFAAEIVDNLNGGRAEAAA